MYLSVVRKGMTLTSHTLIYHCLIYLHQTIFQVSAIAYMSKSDVKRFFIIDGSFKTVCNKDECYVSFSPVRQRVHRARTWARTRARTRAKPSTIAYICC